MLEIHCEYYNKVASFYKHAHYVEKQCRLLVSFYRHYSKFWGDSWMLTLSKNALTKYKMLPYNLEGHRPILGICLVMMILYVRWFYILLMCSHHASMHHEYYNKVASLYKHVHYVEKQVNFSCHFVSIIHNFEVTRGCSQDVTIQLGGP